MLDLEKPFQRLTHHFVKRIFYGAGDGDDLQFGIPVLLGLLSTPSAFGAIVLMNKYSTLLLFLTHRPFFDVYRASIADEYFFIVYSMVVTGAVIVLKWDRLFPDRQDYDNFAALPISTRQLFVSSLLALLFLAAIFAITVNWAATFIFPFAVTSRFDAFGPYIEFFIGHGLAVVSASLFACFALLSVMGLTIALTPQRYFRRVSLSVRILCVVGIAMTFGTVFQVPRLLLSPAPPAFVSSLPPVWFLDLHQFMIGRGTPFTGSYRLALEAVLFTFVFSLLVYALTYYRQLTRTTEVPRERSSCETDRFALVRRFAERFWVRSSFQQSVYFFSLKTLFRSERHCLLFGSAAGIGLFVAAQTLTATLADTLKGPIDAPILALPLTIAYLLLCSLRALFDLPTHQNANWIFKTTVDRNAHECRTVGLKLMLTTILPWLILLAAPIYVMAWGWTTGLVHTAYVLLSVVLLAELLLVGFRKIPFTCTRVVSRERLLPMIIVFFVGLSLFSTINSRIELYVLEDPSRLFWFVLMTGAIVFGIEKHERERPPADRRLIFEEHAETVIHVLDLGDMNANQSPDHTVSADRRNSPWLDALRQDITYGLRTLRHNKVFAFVAITSLGLGIGATTALLTAINAVFFKPVPVYDASRLVAIGSRDPAFKRTLLGWDGLSLANFQDIREQVTGFSDLASSARQRYEWNHDGGIERLSGEIVTTNYFDVLGVKPVLGRRFLPDDDPALGANAVIVSFDLWNHRLGRDRAILGRHITLNSISYVVIGVAPGGFRGTQVLANADQFWIPIGGAHGFQPLLVANRRDTAWAAFARIRVNVTAGQATAELQAAWTRLATQFPSENGGLRLRVASFQGFAHNTFSGALLPFFSGLLLTIVVIILMVVCINLANLQLARAAHRQREINVRLALGGSRGRIIRQLLTESVILSTIGGAASLVVVYAILAIVSPVIRANVGALDLGIDTRVFLLFLFLAAGSGILLGLAPAIRVSSPDIRSMLLSAGSTATHWRTNRLSRFLVVSQIALSLIMLTFAGIFARVFEKAATRDLGFDYQNVASAQLDLPESRYTPARGNEFFREVAEQLRGRPGIDAVVIEGSNRRTAIFSEESEKDPGYQPLSAATNSVSMNFYSALHIRLLVGRDFSDLAQANQPVVIVTKGLAERLWPGMDPIGKRLHFSGDAVMREVVGVLRDPDYTQIVPLVVVTPIEQLYQSRAAIRIHSVDNPSNHLPDLHRAIESLDGTLPPVAVELMRDRVQQETIAVAIVGLPIHLAAAFAIALAIIGLYGVTTYALVQRTREIGIRTALGAQRRDVILMILSDGAKLVSAGALIGIGIFRAATPLLASSLPLTFNVKDPIVTAGATIILTFVTLLACYLPARRATRVDPIIALRYE